MGYVADWNRQDHKKGASAGKVTVRKFSEGGPVTEDTREKAAGASYDSITDFMNYVRGRGQSGKSDNGGYTRTDAKGVRENELPEDPIVPEAAPAAAAAPVMEGEFGDSGVESARKPVAPRPAARQRARVVRAASAPVAVKPAAPPVTPVATPEQKGDVRQREPVGAPIIPTPSSSIKRPAMDRQSMAMRASGTTLQSLLDMRPPTGRFKDGGLVSDSNWTRGNFKKSGC